MLDILGSPFTELISLHELMGGCKGGGAAFAQVPLFLTAPSGVETGLDHIEGTAKSTPDTLSWTLAMPRGGTFMPLRFSFCVGVVAPLDEGFHREVEVLVQPPYSHRLWISKIERKKTQVLVDGSSTFGTTDVYEC